MDSETSLTCSRRAISTRLAYCQRNTASDMVDDFGMTRCDRSAHSSREKAGGGDDL